jgi:hypothetical protein
VSAPVEGAMLNCTMLLDCELDTYSACGVNVTGADPVLKSCALTPEARVRILPTGADTNVPRLAPDWTMP